MNASRLAIVTLALLLATGCSSAEKSEVGRAGGMGGATVDADTRLATPAGQPYDTAPEQRLLVKRAYLTIEADDFATFAPKAQAIARRCGGFVQNTASYERSVTLTLRVAATQLDECLDQLEKLGDVETRSVSAEDVTEQIVDLDARRANLVTLRDRLRALLAKAANVGETVAVEKELGRVQGDLDALDARLKVLRSTVALSEVTVTATQPRILGPLGYLAYGVYWVVAKLFVIR